MKFGQLIEYKWETFFLKNLVEFSGETFTRPFLKS